MPSIIPVTVDTAREFPLSASYFPKSAEQAEDIILLSPLIQKPRMNIRMKKIAVGRSFAVKVIVKLTAIDIRTAPKATGERFPCIKSEMYPRAILPNIAPISIEVDRFAIPECE